MSISFCVVIDLMLLNFIHLGLERDLAAIGEKVKDLDSTAQRLMQTHPDQAQTIYDHQNEIVEKWNALTKNSEARKLKLLDSYDLQRFLSDFRYFQNCCRFMSS